MCNGRNTGYNCGYGTWNYGCGWLNTLFDNGTQYVCRDACGNIRTKTGTGCGCNHNCCQCCQYNQCGNDNTGTQENDNGGTNNGFICITRCGNWQTATQTSTNGGVDYNGFGRCSRRCGYNYYND